jgi:ATP-dependent Clp protease protease subunit
MGGSQGQATDIKIAQSEISFMREKLIELLSGLTKTGADKIRTDITRTLFLTPEQALDYGLIDTIIQNSVKTKTTGRI